MKVNVDIVGKKYTKNMKLNRCACNEGVVDKAIQIQICCHITKTIFIIHSKWSTLRPSAIHVFDLSAINLHAPIDWLAECTGFSYSTEIQLKPLFWVGRIDWGQRTILTFWSRRIWSPSRIAFLLLNDLGANRNHS